MDSTVVALALVLGALVGGLALVLRYKAVRDRRRKDKFSLEFEDGETRLRVNRASSSQAGDA